MTDIEANFADAHPPLSPAQALIEANRCSFCYDAPCTEACPTEIDVPGFIRAIATGNMAGAAHKILEQNILGGACARVCPTEILCQRACVWNADEKPIAIGALQRVATDWQMRHGNPFTRAAETGKKIAIVGAGPAGLACAHALARAGHAVTIFEAKPKPGGLNEYGIAAYKMADDFARREVEFLLALGGIEIFYNRTLGHDLSLEALEQKFDAIFLAVGQAGVKALNIPGEDLPGVRHAVDFIAELRQAGQKSEQKIGARVIVIGGGNTAIDAAVQARFLGARDVTILYRRGPENMSATHKEREWAQTRNVAIRFFAAPRAITQTPEGLRVETDIGPFYADTVLKAVGQTYAGPDTPSLADGRIRIDGNHATDRAKIFAGGDCTAGQDLTVRAVQDGKRAARAIENFLGA